MNTDDKISAILRMEADAVEPSAAGYDAIRAGIEARRRRTWWVRGGGFAGAALATAAAVVAFTTASDPTAIEQPPTSSSPSVSAEPSESPSATPTVAPLPDSTPLNAVWPLTTQGELRAWQADPTTYPSLGTVSGSALAFARNYLLVSDATVASSDVRGASLFFEVWRGTEVVSTLELRGFGAGGSAPYVVVAARHDAVNVATPVAGEKVASPLKAHGEYDTVDPSILVRLRADGPGSAPIELGDRHAVTGPPNVWDTEIGFTTTATTGSLMVTLASLRDEGIAAAAVVPLAFPPSAAQPSAKTIVGISDQRLAVYDATTGTRLRYLTEQEPGGGPGGPDVSPDGRRVAWSQGAGTCGATLFTMPVAGGERVRIDGAGNTAGVASSPAWLGNTKVAYAYTTCGPTDGTDKTELRVHDLATGSTTTLATLPGYPGQMASSPDGKHLAYVLDGDVRTYVVATGETHTVPSSSRCDTFSVDIAGTTTAGEPILLTLERCTGPSEVVVNRFARTAPDRDRVADIQHDAVEYTISFDPADSSLLVSHGIEDGPSYVESIDRNGTKKRVATGLLRASW